MNRLILIGNGFDLAHGLKTSYRNFIDWYILECHKKFRENLHYSDALLSFKYRYAGQSETITNYPKGFQEVFDLMEGSRTAHPIEYNSDFFKKLLKTFQQGNWVSIEIAYYHFLKSFYTNNSYQNKRALVNKLNSEFCFLIEKINEYVQIIDSDLKSNVRQTLTQLSRKLRQLFEQGSDQSRVLFLNFNYTQTLELLRYADPDEIVHIHGDAKPEKLNPLMFGYGDETDPTYQMMEDTGENFYLDHIKSFGYFKTNNYHKLITFIDSAKFEVSIIGHSCGLSDRVLLSEIFNSENCQQIDIYYYEWNGIDNFKELTQEISRHFNSKSKTVMRRKIATKNLDNLIPQLEQS